MRTVQRTTVAMEVTRKKDTVRRFRLLIGQNTTVLVICTRFRSQSFGEEWGTCQST